MQRTQTTEENEVRTTERPSCWQEPEQETYWRCIVGAPEDGWQGKWVALLLSAAEAELRARQKDRYIVRLERTTLAASLAEAQVLRRPGVRVYTYLAGEWVTLHEYPVGH